MRVYNDQALWERMSDNGWNLVNEAYSEGRAVERFDEIFKHIGKENLLSGPAAVATAAPAPETPASRRKRK